MGLIFVLRYVLDVSGTWPVAKRKTKLAWILFANTALTLLASALLNLPK